MGTLIKQLGWHEWLCKTNFSFLLGASHPEDLLNRAQACNYSGLCISDMDGVYGLARSYLRHKNLDGASFGLRYGMEIHLEQDHHLPILLQKTLVLVARSFEGYQNICKINDFAHRHSKDKAFISIDDLLKQDVKDVVALQPMRGIMRQPQPAQKPILENLKHHFNDHFYLCASRHLHTSEDIWLPSVFHWHKKLDLPFLYSQDAFFHTPQQKPLSDVLHAIRSNKVMDEAAEHFFPNSERYLHQLDALEKVYGTLPHFDQAMQLSKELYESCHFSLSELRYQYPKEMIPENHTAQSYLESLTWEGAKNRYGEHVPSKVVQTLTHELDLIQKLKFADYFLTVWDIVRWARSQDILCQGRGSAANSTVCFVLGVTSADPSLFDLLFERFISMERGDPPDIDVDFEHERREEVIQYIYERYGRKRAAMVANVITFKAKGALRAVGKALGVEESTLGIVSKTISSKYFRKSGNENILHFAKSKVPKASTNTPIPWKLWSHLSEELRGFPRHMGIHSGGFVISQSNLSEIAGQEPASMEGRSVIQWCKEDIEGLGLFKIDVLALGMLTAVRKCLHMVNTHYNRKLELYSIPQDDEPTYKMIQKANTVGTFQIESRAQMSMLPRLKPKCFYDLVIEVAIIRPGPIQGKVIHPYLKRRDGVEPITYPDERLKPILSRTLGIAIFQEQAMRIAIAVGDFTPGEANELRKNIGVWNSSHYQKQLSPWLEKLERGMKKNNIAPEFVQQIMGQMRGFADYGFPESHAISFALIAYASSFLKCHYPAAFFASVLNSQPMGFYSPHALLQAAKRDGVNLLPICINSSNWDHILEDIRTSKARPKLFAIRIGFRLVNGLSAGAAERIEQEREKRGPFKNMEDLLRRVRLYRDDLTALAAANAFEVFQLDRKQAIWYTQSVPTKSLVETDETKVEWKKDNQWEQVNADFKSFNTSLGPHPSLLIKKQWPYAEPLENITFSRDFPNTRANKPIHVFGMVLAKQAPPSAKGMVFITLEDEWGFINLAIPPNVYDKHFETVESQGFLCAHGVFQQVGSSHSILVKSFVTHAESKAVPLKRKRPSQRPSLRPIKAPRSYH